MEENINAETISVKSRKKRRKKNVSSSETNETNKKDDNLEVNYTEVAGEREKDETEPKKKRKRKQTQCEEKADKVEESHENSIHHHISQLHEDVVNVSEQPLSQSTQHLLTSVWHTNLNNSSNSKLFIERARGAFKAIKSEKSINAVKIEEKKENVLQSKSVVAAINLHTNLQKLAKFAHGLLAGFAVYHLLLVNCLEFSQISLLFWFERYSKLSQPIEAMFYLMSIFCLWMILARSNIGGEEGMLCQHSRYFYGICVIVILYATTTIVSLSLAKMNAEISLIQFNQTTTEQVLGNAVPFWKNFNICRSIAAGLAWMVLCISYPCDLNKTFLKKILMESPIVEQQKTEA